MMRVEMEVSVPNGNVIDLAHAVAQSLELPDGYVLHRLSVEEDDA